MLDADDYDINGNDPDQLKEDSLEQDIALPQFQVIPGDAETNTGNLLDLYFDIDANNWRSWTYLAK